MFKKGVDDSKIISCLIGKLSDAELRNRLTIIDGYFFSNGKFGFVDTHRRVKEILKPFENNLQILEIITSKRNFNRRNYETLENSLENIELSVIKKDEFHDRFWIVDENLAFVVGTSVNGFGNSHFFIQDDYLSQNDTKILLALYKENQEND